MMVLPGFGGRHAQAGLGGLRLARWVGERIAALQAQRQHLQEKISWYRSQLSAEGRP